MRREIFTSRRERRRSSGTLRASKAHPFPSLLRKVERGAGWATVRCFDARCTGRPSRQTFDEPFLLSTPHPPLRGAFPAFAEKEGARPPTCVYSGSAAGPADANLILWRWGARLPHKV